MNAKNKSDNQPRERIVISPESFIITRDDDEDVANGPMRVWRGQTDRPCACEDFPCCGHGGE